MVFSVSNAYIPAAYLLGCYDVLQGDIYTLAQQLNSHALTLARSINPATQCAWCVDLECHLTEAHYNYLYTIEQEPSP